MQAAGKNQTPAWPSTPSKSHQSYRGCASRNPSSAGHRPSWGPAPATVPVGPSCASQAGRLTDEPAGQRVAFPYFGTEHGVGNPGSLAHCLPRMVCLTLVRQPSSLQPTGPECRLILAGSPSEHGPEHGCCGPGPASWADVGRKGTCQGGRLSEGCHQPPGLIFLSALTWG